MFKKITFYCDIMMLACALAPASGRVRLEHDSLPPAAPHVAGRAAETTADEEA